LEIDQMNLLEYKETDARNRVAQSTRSYRLT
jgi:hypothetical protein